MSRIKAWVLCCAVVCSSCSGADQASSPRGGTQALPTASANAGRGAAPTTSSASNDPNAFGNSTVPVQQQMPAVMPIQPAQMPAAGGIQPKSIDTCTTGNTAGLSDADVMKLMSGGAVAGLRWLYPYDGTVFPRGMLPPSLFWEGADSAQAVYVHIKASRFEYKGCLKPSAAGQLDLPDDVWTTAGEQTMGTVDPYKVELSAISGGTVSGPITETWTIAQATIKGSIYYNSYASQLAAASGNGLALGGSGAVLRIQKGKSAEVFINAQGCTACHTVSATGNRIVAHVLPGAAFGDSQTGASYAVTPMTAPNPSPLVNMLGNAAFAALTPDGTLFVTNAHQDGVGPRAGGPGAIGDPDSKVFQTDTGTEMTGTGIPATTMTPMFAPDGKLLAFTDYAIANGHGLAVMDFDVASQKATGYRKVFTESDMSSYPAWPFFLPDSKALVFAIGNAVDFSGMGAGIGGGVTGPLVPNSDVYIVDLASGTSTLLAQAMGFGSTVDATSNKTYLPFGADEELHHNFYPTVAPVPAGGYFWVFFDSLRHYGNEGIQRQLWGTAVDVSADGSYTTDPSHPPFYVTGQEAKTGNHRAFAALDPCMKDGDTCTSGTDCCGGFCYVKEDTGEFMGEPMGTCSSTTPMCAKLNEKCTTRADCCPPPPNQPPYLCIAGYCATVPPPH